MSVISLDAYRAARDAASARDGRAVDVASALGGELARAAASGAQSKASVLRVRPVRRAAPRAETGLCSAAHGAIVGTELGAAGAALLTAAERLRVAALELVESHRAGQIEERLHELMESIDGATDEANVRSARGRRHEGLAFLHVELELVLASSAVAETAFRRALRDFEQRKLDLARHCSDAATPPGRNAMAIAQRLIMRSHNTVSATQRAVRRELDRVTLLNQTLERGLAI